MPHRTIIDCHTHCYPPELTADPRGWASAFREPYWELVAPAGASIRGLVHPDSMLAAMDAAGIELAVLLGWYWQTERSCRWHNEVIAEWIAHAPERFIGFAAILPNDTVLEQLEYARQLGLQGVGELHFGVQNFNATSPAWQALAQWCVAHRWPVNLHATEAAGHAHPGNCATPLNEFVRMAEQSPDLTLILAHLGGGLPFFALNPRLHSALQHVYYDTAALPLLYDIRSLQAVIDLVGADKLLFGSDYPLRLYPRTQHQPNMRRWLDHIVNEGGLNAAQLDALLGANFKRLLL